MIHQLIVDSLILLLFAYVGHTIRSIRDLFGGQSLRSLGLTLELLEQVDCIADLLVEL